MFLMSWKAKHCPSWRQSASRHYMGCSGYSGDELSRKEVKTCNEIELCLVRCVPLYCVKILSVRVGSVQKMNGLCCFGNDQRCAWLRRLPEGLRRTVAALVLVACSTRLLAGGWWRGVDTAVVLGCWRSGTDEAVLDPGISDLRTTQSF